MMKHLRVGLLLAALVLALTLICGSAYARDCTVAPGDAQRITDVQTFAGQGDLISASNPWAAEDVGEVIYVVHGVGGIVQLTTITQFVHAGHIRTAANASITSTSAHATWASIDATSAILAQVNACKSSSNTSYPSGPTFVSPDAGTVRLSGWYIVSGCIYNAQHTGPTPSIIGSGRYNTVLFTAPTMTPCGNAHLIDARGTGMTFDEFSINGSGILYSYAAALVQIFQSSHVNIGNVSIHNWGSVSTSARALSVITSAHVNLSSVLVQNAPPGDRSTACELQITGTVNDTLCSNYFRNVLISGGSSRTPNSIGMLWRGGGADECYDAQRLCTIVSDNSEFQVNTATFFSTIKLGLNSALFMTNVNVGFYATNSRGHALHIPPTAEVYSTTSTIRSNGGTKAVLNQGAFYDIGGTKYKDCNLSVCTNRTAAQTFQGKQPIRQ